jgi:hypothetical protein
VYCSAHLFQKIGKKRFRSVGSLNKWLLKFFKIGQNFLLLRVNKTKIETIRSGQHLRTGTHYQNQDQRLSKTLSTTKYSYTEKENNGRKSLENFRVYICWSSTTIKVGTCPILRRNSSKQSARNTYRVSFQICCILSIKKHVSPDRFKGTVSPDLNLPEKRYQRLGHTFLDLNFLLPVFFFIFTGP